MMGGGMEERVPEPRTAATTRGDIAATRPRTGRGLGDAITALRRGEPVLIRDDLISVLAVAAELVNEENLGGCARSPARRRASC